MQNNLEWNEKYSTQIVFLKGIMHTGTVWKPSFFVSAYDLLHHVLILNY